MAYLGYLYPAIFSAYESRFNPQRIFRTQEEALEYDIRQANEIIYEYLTEGGPEGLNDVPEYDEPVYRAMELLMKASKLAFDAAEERRLLEEAEVEEFNKMQQEAQIAARENEPVSDEIPF